MGLLDDAIREHLELKRRRGADPLEVSRQENEALGPVRRDPVPGAEGEPELDNGAEVPAFEHEPLPGDGAVEPRAEEEEALSPYDDAAYDDEPAAPPAEPFDADAGQPTQMMEPPPPPAAEPPPGAGQETEEWGFDDEPESEEPEAEAEPDEDVLEETPDFLSETPEHDRLWFEQKPPRDFDFDG